MVHETKESSLQKSPTDSWLALLSEHQTDDPKVVSSNHTGDIFDEIYFVLYNLRSVREMRIVKNSKVIQQSLAARTPGATLEMILDLSCPGFPKGEHIFVYLKPPEISSTWCPDSLTGLYLQANI